MLSRAAISYLSRLAIMPSLHVSCAKNCTKRFFPPGEYYMLPRDSIITRMMPLTSGFVHKLIQTALWNSCVPLRLPTDIVCLMITINYLPYCYLMYSNLLHFAEYKKWTFVTFGSFGINAKEPLQSWIVHHVCCHHLASSVDCSHGHRLDHRNYIFCTFII